MTKSSCRFARWCTLALLLGATGAAPPLRSQGTPQNANPKDPAESKPQAGKPDEKAKPEEKIVVTQTPTDAADDAKARAVLQQMVAAMGGDQRMQRRDYHLDGRTASFFKNEPTSSTEYTLFHHPLAGSTFEDRVELTKKRDIVQIWTPTDGYEVTFKGRKDLPKEDREAYFRRQQYSLDSVVTTWINDPKAILFYEGRKLVSRRQADAVTIVNAQDETLHIDIEAESHLPIRRSFKTRNEKYKDFDEDVEEYSDWHTEAGVPVPYATTRYFNGDMVSERFVTRIDFAPVNLALFSPTAPLGKHK